MLLSEAEPKTFGSLVCMLQDVPIAVTNVAVNAVRLYLMPFIPKVTFSGQFRVSRDKYTESFSNLFVDQALPKAYWFY